MHRINRLTIVKLSSDSCCFLVCEVCVDKKKTVGRFVLLGTEDRFTPPQEENNNCQTISFVPNGE